MADTLTSIEPATGEVLWTGPTGDAEAEVAAARSAWAGWAARPFAVRVETLRRFANVTRAKLEPFADLNDAERADLARALKTVLLKFDGLWNRPFPYLMAWYQAPLDGVAHPEAHLHAEFYPPYRTETKLKYLAGTEIAAGLFAMDALPEDKARDLQQVEVTLE